MQLDALELAAQEIAADIRSSFPTLTGHSGTVHNFVTEQIGTWRSRTASILNDGFPLASEETTLRIWQDRAQAGSIPLAKLADAVGEYSAFCKLIGHPANEAFWKRQFDPTVPQTAIAQKFKGDVEISTRLLLTEWQKRMDEARARWAFDELAARRAALVAELYKILRLVQELQERLASLGLDAGILLDLSKGTLTSQDIQQFERWAAYLAEDKGVQRLCELLGKIRQIELSERIERVTSSAHVNMALPDIHSREEIVGIRLGRDIEHVLPSELALLADPDTSVLFDLKFVESGLMCFDMQGILHIDTQADVEDEQSVKDADELGPMVICIDTSGSMSGTPETIAKAISLFLATKAREQKRTCYLINFSTDIDTLDLSGDTGMEEVLRFLGMSFHGGTDVAPALEHALDTMEQDAYLNADLLVISDFVMSSLPDSLLARIDKRRLDGNRFHSLVVGECYLNHRLRTLFDNEWIYDPCNGSIHELLAFEHNVRMSPLRP